MQNRKVIFRDLGRMRYKEAWDLQEKLFAEIVEIKVRNRDLPEADREPTPNYLLFVEHEPVYTLGKSGHMANLLLNEENLAKRGIEFFKNNRGGDITYHGPGQIVGYPILDLDNFFTDIHIYMRSLEETMIRMLAGYGITADRLKGLTGVWLDENHPAKARKICALGVKCSRWVTMHGWALNVNTDLGYFQNIIPCGITDKAVTSLERELGEKQDFEAAKDRLLDSFAEVFQCEITSETAVGEINQ